MANPTNITNCFQSGSVLDISSGSGEIIEDKSTVTALTSDNNLECDELIETDDFSKYTSLTADNMIVFTENHQIVCKEFIETDD